MLYISIRYIDDTCNDIIHAQLTKNITINEIKLPTTVNDTVPPIILYIQYVGISIHYFDTYNFHLNRF